MARALSAIVLAALLLAGCGSSATTEEEAATPESASGSFEPAPEASTGPLDAETAQALDRLLARAGEGRFDTEALERVAATGDARLAWLVSDLLRFAGLGPQQQALTDAFAELTGVDVGASVEGAASPWLAVTDRLIAWDLPAPPRYRQLKARVYLPVENGWRPFFADARSEIDWRLVSWGGVPIDDRPPGDTQPCPQGCIPALDDPVLTPASEGDWYPDDAVVFGVVINGEAVAFPKNMMEVHEMVNLTVAGRRVGIPYCTLCGSAQAYFLDRAPGHERLVLRTSGLLQRSNKLMYELTTGSAIDTFTGEALSGPLRAEGVRLEQATVVASPWDEWRRAHPDTRIVAEDGGIGRTYPDDPLMGRDDEGPIFPVGDVDPRLPVQEPVVGVIAPDGTPVAFQAAKAREALADGEEVSAGGIALATDGGGLRARSHEGASLPAHEAFWFAWSQFHPETELWRGGAGAEG